VLNIYTLAGKKFLKWTNEDCSEEYYTALENIRTFTRHGAEGLKFIQKGQGYYNVTSYKFSDLEDSVRKSMQWSCPPIVIEEGFSIGEIEEAFGE
jgi:hypothetical protein